MEVKGHTVICTMHRVHGVSLENCLYSWLDHLVHYIRVVESVHASCMHLYTRVCTLYMYVLCMHLL